MINFGTSVNDQLNLVLLTYFYSFACKYNYKPEGSSKIMISGYDKEQLDEWKANLYSYEKQKRTKKPFHI